MKKIVRLTESDLVRIVKRVLNEQIVPKPGENPEFDKVFGNIKNCCMKAGMQSFPTNECGPVIFDIVLGKTPDSTKIQACSSKIMSQVPTVAVECVKCFMGNNIQLPTGKLPDISKLPIPKIPGFPLS